MPGASVQAESAAQKSRSIFGGIGLPFLVLGIIFAVISKIAVHFFVPAGAGNIFAFRSPLLLRN